MEDKQSEWNKDENEEYSKHPFNDEEEQAHFKQVVSAYFNYMVT